MWTEAYQLPVCVSCTVYTRLFYLDSGGSPIPCDIMLYESFVLTVDGGIGH